jgi:hypothetical protein
MAGKINQPKNTITPRKIIKTSTKSPIIIKINLTIAPRTREIKLEKKTSKYLPMSKPLPYDHLYLCQCEKKVLKSKGIEK